MSEIKLNLDKRAVTGKKSAALRADGLVPSVVYGAKIEPITTQSPYNETEKAVRTAGYHSTLDLDIDGKTQLAIVKNVDVDPVTRKIINVEFMAVSADQAVEAAAPIVLVDFDSSEAAKLKYAVVQVMDEISVKAKPSDLPKELTVDASKFATLEDKLTISDIKLPKGVEFTDKELDQEQVIANLYDPAAEAAARAAAEEAEKAAEAAEEATESEGEKAESDAAEQPAADKAEKSEE